MDELLRFNVLGPKQYSNRYKGFNGELRFADFYRQQRNKNLVGGGLFIPLIKTDDSFKDSVYILTCPEPLDRKKYQWQLKAAQKIANRGQYLATYRPNEELDNWLSFKISHSGNIIDIPYPSSFKIFKFQNNGNLLEISISSFLANLGFSPEFKKKVQITDSSRDEFMKNLSKYETNDITHIYITRFILDCLCSDFQRRGAPLDIDSFVINKKREWCILEIKEKYPTRNYSFGMDVRRIISLRKLASIFNVKAYLIVHHVTKGEQRKFRGWKFISMEEFEGYSSKSTVEGGHGMRAEHTSNPTVLCSVSNFKDFK